jgi:hypothetical protein
MIVLVLRISALERVDYSSRPRKLRWPLWAWLGVCCNPIDVDRITVVVDNNSSRFDD